MAERDREIDEIEDRLAAGEVVEVDPDIADRMGAFEEDALTEADALEARTDQEEEDDGIQG